MPRADPIRLDRLERHTRDTIRTLYRVLRTSYPAHDDGGGTRTTAYGPTEARRRVRMALGLIADHQAADAA